jgi:hypothetical protein
MKIPEIAVISFSFLVELLPLLYIALKRVLRYRKLLRIRSRRIG